MSDREHREDELPEAIERLATALRREVPVRPSWRDAVLRDVAAEPAPTPDSARVARSWMRGRVSVAPPALAAAAVLCIAIGATAALLLTPDRRSTDIGSPPTSEPAYRLVADARPLGAPAAGGTAVRFVIVAPNASRVSVVGDFNGWNPSAAPMRRVEGGDAWVRDVVLESGRHVYAFVVDDAIHVDPTAPRAAEDDFGVPSSAIVVPAVAQ